MATTPGAGAKLEQTSTTFYKNIKDNNIEALNWIFVIKNKKVCE